MVVWTKGWADKGLREKGQVGIEFGEVWSVVGGVGGRGGR